MGVRNREIHFVVSEEELERIRAKMEELGVSSMSAYMRKMALDGYCVRLELDDVKQMTRLLRYTSNNLNQYVKRAHESGDIYTADIQDLQIRLDEIWESCKKILVRLSSIQ
ncbi:MAG: MobC family plasmid mobilization relaxosome protein [Clostridiales bacterium]|nr:MobC family plasmid mobilization relaxosome protein [Clostridiales bacterium]